MSKKTYNQYPKGSEWAKWDLHVHTPLTNLNNQYKNDWEDWVNKIKENELKVLGITNYFNFAKKDGKHEIEIVKEKLNDYTIQVFPNLEFRVAQPNKTGEYINIHVLFSNKVALNKIDEFLNRLPVKNLSNKYCSSLTTQKELESAIVDEDKLKEQLGKDFKELEDYLIICVPNGYGGFRANNKEGRSVEVANKFDKMAHAFFARPQDQEFFLRNDRYENSQPKPVIYASDAHKLEDIGNDKFTWIKANPTFEGLRQIIFEPEYRLKIQEAKPEQKKASDVIDKVRFVDSSNEKRFTNEWIEINHNLTAIIGGKSTGKTLLLHHIVQSIGYTDNKYDFKSLDFEVMWGDGEIYRLSDTAKKDRPITYIAQQELVDIVEDNPEKFTELILEFLKEKENFKSSFDSFGKNNEESEGNIKNSITDYIRLFRQLEQELNKKLGDKKAKENEIKNNESRIEEIKEKANLSDEEKQKYEQLEKSKKDLENEKYQKEKLLDILKEYKNFIDEKVRNLSNDLSHEQRSVKAKIDAQKLDLDFFEKFSLQNIIEELQQDLKDKFILIQDLEIEIKDLDDKIVEVNKQIDEIAEILGSQETIQKLQEEITNYNKEIQNIIKQEHTIQEYESKMQQISENIFSEYEKVIEEYKKLITEINDTEEYHSLIKESNITLTASVEYKEVDFNENFLKCFNGNKIRQIFPDLFDNREYQYDNSTTHLDTIKKVFDTLTKKEKEELFFNNGKNIEMAMQALFSNNFDYKFNLRQDGDDILKMSPGKKGLVLLKLHLSLKNAKYPILIDQPEDNLDNRTVFSELKNFIKDKKIQRQIIIVTHNANLIMATDAEQIIVANQKGQNGTEEQEYNFEYVTGGLEYSFEKKSNRGILYDKGIKEHICEILEGGIDAFKKREEKYGF